MDIKVGQRWKGTGGAIYKIISIDNKKNVEFLWEQQNSMHYQQSHVMESWIDRGTFTLVEDVKSETFVAPIQKTEKLTEEQRMQKFFFGKTF